MERTQIFHAIDQERDYQNKKWPGDKGRTFGDFLIDIENRLAHAKQGNYDRTTEVVQAELVKIAALCCAAMEQPLNSTSGLPA